MSVDCAVMFADPERTVIRMTVHDYDARSFDFRRAVNLAVAAYESRMKRPPPLIKEPELIAGCADIHGMQYRYIIGNGEIFTMTGAEYKRSLLFASIFNFKPEPGDGNGDAAPERHGRRRRPRPRSMAEWEQQKRERDLRRLVRADSALRRELLKTFDRCPCCDQPLTTTADRSQG